MCKRPGFWASLYFLALVVFGLLYLRFHTDFYQSAALIEARSRNTVFSLEERLCRVFDSVLDRFNQGVPAFRDASVTLVKATSADVTFVLCYRLVYPRQATPSVKRLFCTLTVPKWTSDESPEISEIPMTVSDPSGTFLFHFAGGPKGYGGYIRMGELRGQIERSLEDAQKAGNMEAALYTDDTLLDLLRQYQSLSVGMPSRDSGVLARSFYLSAVTITTLGYGDVVPMTDRARILVALEAVMGVGLAGLFLTSVAARYRRPAARGEILNL